MKHLYTVARVATLAAVLLIAAPMVASAASSDEALAKEVSAQLMDNKKFDATNIIVTAKDGVVHLRGEVQKASEAKAMEEAAKGVPGVQGVEAQIDVLNKDRP